MEEKKNGHTEELQLSSDPEDSQAASQPQDHALPEEPPIFEDSSIEADPALAAIKAEVNDEQIDSDTPAARNISRRKHKKRETGMTVTEPEADILETPAVQAFVPTDYFTPDTKRRTSRKKARQRKLVLTAILTLVAVLVGVGGMYVWNLKNNPSAYFGSNKTPLLQDISVSDATPTPEPDATPTIDPYAEMYAQADTSMMQNIVNVLVIGVDYADERESWNGKHAYHADVMMVLAINFDENRVDLISIPRDTYADIPDVKGIYKLNASLDCGGGLYAEGGAGFNKVCESVSWVLGGIPVDYYYAVTMPAVKQLVDTVGGVDYDLELDFKMAGRTYKKGQQHMNGQAVLDYLRVRKNVAASGDQNRVNRQKKMMIALFQSMQQQNLLLKIPDIVSAFNGQLFTNCTLNQTMALSLFAYKLSSENIGMHSIGGTIKNIFGWNFCITDQSNRVAVIQEVYGIDASPYRKYSMDYADYRWQSMLATQYLDTCEKLTSYVADLIAADDLLPTISPTPEISETPEESVTPDPGITNTPEPVDTPVPEGGGNDDGLEDAAYHNGILGNGIVRLSAASRPVVREQTQQYGEYERTLFATYLEAFTDLENAAAKAATEASRYAKGNSNSLKSATSQLNTEASHLKNAALSLASAFGYSTGKLNWDVNYWTDRSFNEIEVDFR